eukprot:936481_1
MLTTFLLHIFLVPITDGQWISYTNPAVPKKDIQMAVGVWNDHVFLLGGYNTLTRRSLIEFDGSQFDDKGEVLPINTWGYGDYYAQIENNLFMIDPTMSRLNVFNMALTTNQFTTFAIIPSDVNEQGCLATDSDHLFVVGGYSYSSSSPLDTVQILDIAEMSWQNGVSMKTARKQLSCIVDPYTKTLYAIGGNNGTDINSVEFINTTIMDTWESIQPGLTNPAVAARSVVHVQTIYVVGGRYWDGAGHELDTVHIINPQQNTITLSNDRLPYGVYHLALCVIDNFFHGFGGSDDYGYSDKWMKYQLPSPPTTNTPTSQTIPPTRPTSVPTIAPTSQTTPPTRPTSVPTTTPTLVPTSTPTTSPSTIPTFIPSLFPSLSPTISQFIQSDTPKLYRKLYRHAIGYWESNITLLGGDSTVLPVRQQMQKYDVANDKMIDYGTFFLANGIFGVGQFYAQISNHLYIVAAS